MLSLLATAVLLTTPATDLKVLDLTPTDDVWVYPHASDPSKDEYLRIWGVEGASVAPSGERIDDYSYSFLKWNLADIPKDAKLVGATLVLTHIANPEFTAEMTKQTPIEVRPMPSSFSERTWQHSAAATYAPKAGPKEIFGTGFPTKTEKNDKVIPFEIDLLKGPNDFKAYLTEAQKNGNLALALTSAIDPSQGRASVYKLFSKDGPKENRPILRLKFDN